jgi:hypothetical protein
MFDAFFSNGYFVVGFIVVAFLGWWRLAAWLRKRHGRITTHARGINPREHMASCSRHGQLTGWTTNYRRVWDAIVAHSQRHYLTCGPGEVDG